jgi:insulysin
MLQGLAHFTEHMLFLGSDRYPNGDDYFKTITENNGHFNAYTDREITNYFFDIHYYSYDTALDIFSRFFIDPLFNSDKVSKEVNAVNSEYEKNLIIDNRKRSQIISYIAQADNPYHRFTTGNIETLVGNAIYYGLDLREELIKFHSKYYTADKMKLILFSNDDLDDLEDMAINKFSEIKPSAEYSISNNSTISNKVKQIHKSHSPFNKDTLGTLIRFNSLIAEHEMVISFIQPPLSASYNINPSFYFSYLFETKDENSLIDVLKKKQLATKLTSSVERDLHDWSDLSIQISLTTEGGHRIEEVLQIIHNYFNYMRSNLINKKTFDYLKKISKLNFEYRTIHTGMTYEFVNKLAAKSLNSPIEEILDNTHILGEFNQTLLHSYANNLRLENSIVQIPIKMTNSSLNFLHNNTESHYEPWYKTNFTISKINFNYLNFNNNTKSFTHPELSEVKVIDYLLNNTSKCDFKCIENLRSFKTEDPSILNRTSSYEYWYKHENTLDFNRTSVELEFVYNNFNSTEDKINLVLLESLIRRKLKKINSKLSFFGHSIKVTINHYGLKIAYLSFTTNAVQITRHIVDKLSSIYKNKEFNGIYQEVKDLLTKEYNAQPYVLAYEYLKNELLKDYVTSEDYLDDLSNLKESDFDAFLENFKNNYYLKVYISGELDKKHSNEIFESMHPLLLPHSSEKIKNIIFDIGKKRKNRRKPIKLEEANYLVKKIYHQDENKNNALLKCYKVGKNDYKNEIMINLFHNIIGNIVFRELRTNRQFGYVAKSKIEVIDSLYVIIINPVLLPPCTRII